MNEVPKFNYDSLVPHTYHKYNCHYSISLFSLTKKTKYVIKEVILVS